MSKFDKTQFDDKYLQHTLKDSFSFIGVGLHSGLKTIMSVFPAEINTGYTFVRRDLNGQTIKARWNTVTNTQLSTTVSNSFGARVSTIEHLIAALSANGVDNAHIVMDSPEVPIIDGCAQSFVEVILKIGTESQAAQRRAIVIKKAVRISEGDKFVSLSPAPALTIDMEIDFKNPSIGSQKVSLPCNANTFNKDIAPARTFGFKNQIEVLNELGLCKGGTLKNAILIDEDRVLNKEGLRFTDELARHKYMDVVGDLALAGAHMLGKYEGRASGHKLNNDLLRQLMTNYDAWTYTTLKTATEMYDEILDETEDSVSLSGVEHV